MNVERLISRLVYGFCLTSSALLLVMCLAGRPAVAQPRPLPPLGGERDQQARTLFEQGREAYKDGRYRDAWADFHEAYKLSARPELLFNIGQAADRLGQDSDAIKALTLYLKRLPNAPNRREVENRLQALNDRASSPQVGSDNGSTSGTGATNTTVPAPEPQQPSAAPEPTPRWNQSQTFTYANNDPTPPTPPTDANDIRRGLYIRTAPGLGLRLDGISSGGDSLSMFGYGFSLDLGVGYAILPGFVLGGGLWLDWSSSATVSATFDYYDSATFDLDHANLTSFGPFIDWYPVRKKLGLHVQAGIGLGVLAYKGAGSASSALGATFFLGAGYEWRVVGPFAIGLLLRLTGAALSEDEDSHALFAPSLLVSFTYF